MSKKNDNGNYFVNSLNGMAYGFFCSLIVGTLLKQFGTLLHLEQLITWGSMASFLMGPAIGIGIAYVLDMKGLNLITALIAGAIGAGTFTSNGVVVGNPIGAYVAVVAAVEITKFVQGKTAVDVLIVPITSILVAGVVTLFVAPYVSQLITWIGDLINYASTMQPILMGTIVAVLMGMALTGPISSTAIGVMLGLSGVAAGAALAGCCAQMIGFAVMSIEDNDVGGVIAIGLGTSKLQFKNVVKNPRVWIPPLIAGMITGPIAAAILKISCTPVGSGMGTCGLVGLLSAVEVMGASAWPILIGINIVAPAIITYLIYRVFRKRNYIKAGDLKLTRI